MINVGDGTVNNPTAVLWQNTLVAGSTFGGQANGVTFGDYDGPNHGQPLVVTAVGNDSTQTHMVAV